MLSLVRRFQLVTFFLAAAVASPLFAGQSVVVTPTASVSLADPAFAHNQSWRVEFQIHDWTPPAGSPQIAAMASVGFAVYFRGDGIMSLESIGDTVVEQQPCFLNLSNMRNALVRFQRNVATKKLTCEVWNFDSTGYNTQTYNIDKLGNLPFAGGGLGGIQASFGFLRVFTTLVPLGSRPPVTGDKGDWTELRFDGNLSDSSGRNHNAVGSATYVPTPNQVPVALPKTLGTPFWTNWTSFRAGHPAQLDASSSYTLADGSPAVTYRWQELSGPSTVVWKNRATAQPTITGLIFGSYSFQLEVADTNGKVAASTIDVGAVATDSNGVVVNANPSADAIFGPMIAFGKNPWGWADERNLRMENLQKNTYATPPTWSHPAENGTVRYTFFDPVVVPAMATLSAGITATALAIPLAAIGTLDVSSLPTQVLVGNPASWEIVRVCSVTGSTLNVCYDGRGFRGQSDGSYIRPATAWPSGTKVWQSKVKGTNTHFLTTMCSYGPGWTVAANHAVTSSGTVTPVPGSAAVTGTGTTWDGTQNSLAIAIFAKHGGVPFTFFAYVNSANGTSLTLSRPFLADADPGSYSYHIFSDQRRVFLHYTRTDGSDGSIYFPTAGCETDTDLYLYMGWDNAYAGQLNTASPYSFIDGSGFAGDFSPNYYDMGLAHYAFYFRSGMKQALTSARGLEDYWLHYPEIALGDAGGSPRSRGVIGAVAAAVLDGDRGGNWPGIRTFAQQGLVVAQRQDCNDDMRESAYQLSWLALAAQFDPDPVKRAQWQAGVSGASYTRDNACKRADNSYAPAFYWNPPALQIAATQGSQTGTAVGGVFGSDICFSTASGTATVTQDSARLTVLTGSFIPPSGSFKILVGGTRGGVRYDLATQFHYNSPNSITLGALWSGDTGTVYWSIENNDTSGYILTVAQGPTDTANFGQVTSCKVIDSTHIQFYRPWPTASGTFKYTAYNLVGQGTQPFMAGIKALQMRYAGQVYAPYKDLDVGIATWVGTTGFDATGTKGVYYGRVFPQCEPEARDSGIKDVIFRVTGCIENSYNVDATVTARARNSEAQNAMTVMYLANPLPANRELGDLFYGAAFGAPGYTADGYLTDGLTASNLDDISLGSYKWPGFFFGVGMAHQWPAARVGGVAPPKNRTVYISVNQTAGATAQVLVTAPSGSQAAFNCGSATPCPVTVDDRQGSHWYQILYLSASGAVVSKSDPDLLVSVAP